MKAINFIVLMMLSITTLHAQFVHKDSLNIAYAQWDTVQQIYVIPSDALNNKYEALIIGLEYDSIGITEKKAIEISWPSASVDGRYDLVITPMQIYLRSGHGNPNPDYLYWLATLNGNQFDSIRRYLSQHRKGNFTDCSNDYSYRRCFFYDKAKKEQYVGGDWTNRRYDNLVRLLKILNNAQPANQYKITIPDRERFDTIQPLRLVFNLEILERQQEVIEIK